MPAPKPAQNDRVLRDRRGATRVPVRFPVSVRDATHVWRGDAINLSSFGILLQIPNRLPVGKSLQLELKPERLQPATLRGVVKHVIGVGLLGVQFDTQAVEAFEKAVDLFEGLLAFNPKLAVEVKRRPTQLSKDTILYSIPDCPVTPRAEEARMLTYFVGGKTVGDVERALGDKLAGLMYLPFSMLDRGLLSTVKPGSFGVAAVRRLASIAVVAALLAGRRARADLPPVAFTEDEQARIARGEPVVARREPSDGKGVAAQASMILDATPDEIWSVIDDCAHFKDFMPHTKTSEELFREPGHLVCRVEIALPFPMSNLWSQTDSRETRLEGGGYRRVMNLVQGSYRKFHAAWDLIPQDHGERTLVVYRIEVDPDSAVPDALLRIGQESSLPDTLRAVQKRALAQRAERAGHP